MIPLRSAVTVLTTLALALVALPAAAEPEAPPTAPPSSAPSPFHADAEIDPIAYALNGHSVHVGAGYRKLRVDLGAFALDVPRFVHGNVGFDASFNGFGMKAQYFLFAEQKGFFAGVDAGVSRMSIARDGTDLASRQTAFTAGVNLGLRISLPADFYVTPWIGVSYAFGAKDVALGGATYANNPVVVFPTIHLGYRFR